MWRILSKAVMPLYAVALAGLIVVLSGSPYEFMIGEMQDGKRMSICDLPAPVDDTRDVYAPVMCMLVLALVAMGVVRTVRLRRAVPSLWVGIVLLALWAYRLFLRTVGC